MNPKTGKDWTKTLSRSLPDLSIAAVHVASALTNRGREDGKVIGGAASTSMASPEWGGDTQWEWTYGEECKKFDPSCFGLAKTAEALTRHDESMVPTHYHTTYKPLF